MTRSPVSSPSESGTPVAIVTGSSHGSGELTAVTLARRGHRVFAAMRALERRNAPAAERLRALAAAEALALEPLELDVTDDASVAAAVEQVLAETGRIDIVVNNAGVLFYGLTEAFTIEQARELLDVNVLGSVRVDRAVLPHMRERGSGVLVHVSSIGGRLTIPFYGLYCVGKYALEALAEAYRYELSALGVDSVIVEPGLFRSNLYAALHGPDDRERAESYGETAEAARSLLAGIEQVLASGDARDPQEVADAIVELVETPTGERPLRTVVGDVPVARAINEAAEPHAQPMLESFGLGHLAAISVRADVAATSASNR
jgi:NAD(P)-dependent dehydrogenase (short-subunit alcohol dehydrogenase family)